MKYILKSSRKALLLIVWLATALSIQAAEVVYRIVEFNKTTDDFILSASGQVPQGAWAFLRINLVPLRVIVTIKFRAIVKPHSF